MDILNHFIKINLTFCVARESKFSIWHHLHLSMLPICNALITDRGAKHMLRSLSDPPSHKGQQQTQFHTQKQTWKSPRRRDLSFCFQMAFFSFNETRGFKDKRLLFL